MGPPFCVSKSGVPYFEGTASSEVGTAGHVVR